MPPLQPHSEDLQWLHRLIDRESLESHDITGTISRTETNPRKFVANRRIEKHFQNQDDNYQRVRNLLRAVFNTKDDKTDQFKVSPRDLAQHCTRVFCILVLIDKPEFIGTFVGYAKLWDICLPFERHPPDEFPRDSTDPEFYQKFIAAQWQFCALVLQNHSCLRVPEDQILPFIGSKREGGGVAATVHRVEVHEAHDHIDRAIKPSHLFAIKTFKSLEAQANYDNEREAFRQVTEAGSRDAEGLIEFYGSFEYRGTFNIILQYADAGTLEQMFAQRDPPDTGEMMIAFWANLFQIIKGICEIHEQQLHTNGVLGNTGVLLQGWHQDIKPENILVLRNANGTGYPEQFKIADLGQCHFKTIMEGGPDAEDFDTFGTKTYGAPECYHMTEFSEFRSNLVKRNVDIWSLGCVFSEAYVWMVKGWDGLQQFRLERKKAADARPGWRGGDCFHDGTHMLPQVRYWLDGLKPDLRNDDYASGRVLEQLVYPALQGEPSWRPSAKNLEGNATLVLMTARTELKGPPQTPTTIPRRQSPTSLHGQSPEASPSSPQEDRYRSGSAGSPPLYGREFVLSPQGTQIYNMSSPAVAGASASYASAPPPNVRHQSSPVFNQQDSGPQTDQIFASTSEPTRDIHSQTQVLPSSASATPRHPANDSFRTSQPRISDSIERPLPPARPLPSLGPSRGPYRYSQQAIPPNVAAGSRTANNVGAEVPKWPLEAARAWRAKKREEPAIAKIASKMFSTKKKELDARSGIPNSGWLTELKGRDHVFFMDDSISMSRYWEDAADLAELLVYITKGMDPDGVELFFLSANQRYGTYKNSTDLYNAIRKHGANAYTNLTQCFDDDIRTYAREVQQRNRTPGRSFPTKRSIYVLTDGRLEKGVDSDGHEAIRMLVNSLVEARLPRGQFGVQFIRFGDDETGKARLTKLDHLGLSLDLVDTEPATDNVWKMLLGAINERFDDD